MVHTYGLEGEGASIRTFEFNSHDMVLAAATSERVVRLWDATPDYSTKGVSPPEPHQVGGGGREVHLALSAGGMCRMEWWGGERERRREVCPA